MQQGLNMMLAKLGALIVDPSYTINICLHDSTINTSMHNIMSKEGMKVQMVHSWSRKWRKGGETERSCAMHSSSLTSRFDVAFPLSSRRRLPTLRIWLGRNEGK
jgi:hypothetical protein